MTRPNYPPAPYEWSLRLHVTHGEHEKAQALLDALNAFQRAFGAPDYDMPGPIVGPMEGLDICPVVRLPARNGRARIAA